MVYLGEEKFVSTSTISLMDIECLVMIVEYLAACII